MSAAADLRASLRAGGFRQCSFGSARLILSFLKMELRDGGQEYYSGQSDASRSMPRIHAIEEALQFRADPL